MGADGGAMDFIANATSSIFAQGWTPELQKMVGGQQDAAGLLKSVQAEYRTRTGSIGISKEPAKNAGVYPCAIADRDLSNGNRLSTCGSLQPSGGSPVLRNGIVGRLLLAGHLRDACTAYVCSIRSAPFHFKHLITRYFGGTVLVQ